MSSSRPPSVVAAQSEGRREATLRNIADQLHGCMRRSQDPGKAFICDGDVDRIWSNGNGIKGLLNGWPDDKIEQIRKDFVKILSILVLVGADALLNIYCESYLHNPEFTDYKLPFGKEKLLKFLDEGRSPLFLEQQYKFLPAVIKENCHQVIPLHFRLPFEYENEIARGGFGTIDEVSVAPGCLRSSHSTNWPNPRPLALKRIQSLQDKEKFQEEMMVLRCLKDSDAIHNRVMLHVASFVHGTSLNILLPLAEYRDLEIFLNEGYDFSQKIYDIKETFPSYSTPEFPAQMMTEFSRVTAGLGWLHANLTLGEDGDGYCTHMDLKTDNILVGHDPNCPVGKWMLSDFGLSRFKKITGEWNREARIIQRFSNRTQARRAPATYQAPEVQLREDRTVGRKNDIWSMTCIFSEVFVFALKGKKSLDDFRHARLSHGNDYFYSVKASDGLPASPSQEYEVKNSIVDALDKLAEGRTLDAFQRAWIKCGTNVIREGLTIDQGKRLDATELYAHLRHVRDHCSASSKAEKITCPFDPDRLPDPEPPGTFKLPGWRRSSNDSIPGSLCSSSASANSMGIGGNLPRSHSVGSGIALPQLASSNTARTPVRSFSLGSTVLPRQLVSSNEVDMASLARTPARHPKAISLCPQGQRVAYLFENCIYVYSLNASSKNIASPPIRVDLEPDKTWKYLQLAGSYLVAWGSSHSPSRRPILLCNLENRSQALPIPDRAFTSELPGIVISPKGVVAYNCGETILLNFLLYGHRTSEMPAMKGYQFSNIAFDHSGCYIYAWSFGNGVLHANEAYVWSVETFSTQQQGELARQGSRQRQQSKSHDENINPDHFGRYPTNHVNDHLSSLLPYQGLKGCIVHTPDNDFFPLQLSGSHKPKGIIEKHTVKLSNVMMACVYEGNSLIVVEKQFNFRRLRWVECLVEYLVIHSQDNVQGIDKKGEVLVKCDGSISEKSKMVAIRSNGQMLVIICNWDFTINMIAFTNRCTHGAEIRSDSFSRSG